VCSDYLSILTDNHHADQVTAAVADWLTSNAGRRQGPDADHRWDFLELTGIDAEDDTARRLIAHLRRYGSAVDCRPGPRCWTIPLPETWDEYLVLLSKSHRKKLRRLERAGLYGARARTCWADRPDQTRAGMEILVDLHQRRRRHLGEPGCFSSLRFSAFLREAAAALAAGNRLRLFWIEWEGRPITVEFQLVGGPTVYAYQAGMDPDRLDLQPGRLSCIAGIQHAICEGRSQFDFLRGDEPYKAQWGAVPRPSLCVRVAPRRPLALVRHVTWLAGRRAKQAIKGGWAAMLAKPSPSAERTARPESASPHTNRPAVPGAGPDPGRIPNPPRTKRGTHKT
jgi:hypothetical protein